MIQKGQRLSPKTEFKKGKPSWNKGKKWSVETRKRMSEARKRFYQNGGVHPLLGKEREDMKGENNPNYGKFGAKHPKWTDNKKHPFHKSIREIYKYVNWRKSVFERDNYTCQFCGKKGCYIEADHYPKRFTDIIKENNIKTIEDALICLELWDISNGRTLCRPCHHKVTWEICNR